MDKGDRLFSFFSNQSKKEREKIKVRKKNVGMNDDATCGTS